MGLTIELGTDYKSALSGSTAQGYAQTQKVSTNNYLITVPDSAELHSVPIKLSKQNKLKSYIL